MRLRRLYDQQAQPDTNGPQTVYYKTVYAPVSKMQPTQAYAFIPCQNVRERSLSFLVEC